MKCHIKIRKTHERKKTTGRDSRNGEIGRRRSKMRLEYSILTSLMIMFMLTYFLITYLDELMKDWLVSLSVALIICISGWFVFIKTYIEQ